MKRLHRGPAPECLSDYRHGIHRWESLSTVHHREVWEAIESMQGRLCAYCEGSFDDLGQHMEHFFPKARRPEGTFDWENLFGACDRRDSCGHYKDSKAAAPYERGDLIDPAMEEPDRFFVIRPSGSIEPRPDLNPRDAARAELTLEVFRLNLDGSRSLCAARRRALEFYRRKNPDILETLEEFDASDRATFVQDELSEAAQTPFGSIIRHFFHLAAG